MKVLVINAGSSSIKYQLYQMPEEKVLAKGMVEKIGDKDSKLYISYDGNKQVLEKREKITNRQWSLSLNQYPVENLEL